MAKPQNQIAGKCFNGSKASKEMTSIGFIVFVLAFAAIQFAETDTHLYILGAVELVSFLMMAVGIAIKLWEVMP